MVVVPEGPRPMRICLCEAFGRPEDFSAYIKEQYGLNFLGTCYLIKKRKRVRRYLLRNKEFL
jgi:hypothetical protein